MIPAITGLLAFLLAPVDANVGRLIAFYMTGSSEHNVHLLAPELILTGDS